MRQDIIIINPAGLDNGGAATLGLQYSNILNIRTYFYLSKKGNIEQIKETQKLFPNISHYNEKEDLIKDYIPKIAIINIPIGNRKLKQLEEIIIMLKEKKVKIIFLDCVRKSSPISDKVGSFLSNLSDITFYYTDNIVHSLKGEHKKIGINMYQFKNPDREIKPLENRKPFIFSASRFQGFKGVITYLNTIEKSKILDHDLFKDFYIFYEGIDHRISEIDNKVSGELGLISTLTYGFPEKITKDSFNITGTGFDESKIEKGKISIFTTYDLTEALPRWENYVVYVCPTLGKQKFRNETTEMNRVKKQYVYWENAIEYASLEVIDAGVPVLFSKDYLEAYKHGQELLETGFYYEYYEDIPDVISKLVENGDKYSQIVIKQRELVKKVINDVNKKMAETILKELE